MQDLKHKHLHFILCDDKKCFCDFILLNYATEIQFYNKNKIMQMFVGVSTLRRNKIQTVYVTEWKKE